MACNATATNGAGLLDACIATLHDLLNLSSENGIRTILRARTGNLPNRQNPSFTSCFGSRCQSLATLTCRSR